jgi:hypothetical protein
MPMTWISDTILRLAGPLVLVAVFALAALEASTPLGHLPPAEGFSRSGRGPPPP